MEIDKHIGRILLGYQPALVLMAANQLGIFDALAGSPVEAEQVAQNLNLSPKGTERLLDVLCGLGMVVKENGLFRIPEGWENFLTRKGDQSMHHWIRLNADQLSVWEQLPDFIKSGKPVQSFLEVLGNDPKVTRAFIDGMHTKGLKAIWLVARDIPIGEASHMLDVGGGPGTYTLEWAKLHRHLKGTIFDLPPVVDIAKDYIQQYGLQDRVNTQAGDFNKDDLGSGYDLVLLANILHMYDTDSCKNVIRKAVQSLVPGGRIIIHGFSTDDDGAHPAEDSLFNLGIALFTEGGAAHPIREKVRWLEETGITEIRHFRVEATPSGVITGIKPF